MSDGRIRVLTVSRSFGSGGGAVAREIAERLGWRLVGRELVREVADRLRIPVEEVRARDEHVASVTERVGAFLADAFPEMLLPSFPPARVDHETVRILVESILREAVGDSPVVVLGHGAQCLFRERQDALHVHVDAALEDRVRRVAERRGLPPDEARAEVHRRDHERALYRRQHYGVDWRDPLLYGLLVNTSVLDRERAVRAVIAALGGRE